MKSERGCLIDIAFNQPADDGWSNLCRALFITYEAPAGGERACSRDTPGGSFDASVGTRPTVPRESGMNGKFRE